MENFKFGLISLVFSSFFYSCENKPTIDESIKVEFWHEKEKVTPGKSIDISNFEKIVSDYPNYGNLPEGKKILIKIIAIEDVKDKLSFITRGIDSLNVQFLDSNFKLIGESKVGSHSMTYNNYSIIPFAHFQFSIEDTFKPYYLYLYSKNVNYKLSVYPLQIIKSTNAYLFFYKTQIIHSIYIGSFILLSIFGSFLFILLKQRIYLHYVLALLLSLCMMLINYNYALLFFERIPTFIISKDIYGVLTISIMINYLLFSKEFLEVPQKVYSRFVLISKYLVISSLLVSLTYVIFKISFFENRSIIEFFIFGLSVMSIYLLYQSLIFGYKPAWIFLTATFPVLFIGLIESTSDIHNLPVQFMHSIYYCATFFEMIVLTIGLSFRFKLLQDEKEKVMEELIHNEITTREHERVRIAQDLHDKLGGLVTAAKLNFKIFQNKLQNSDVNYNKGIEILDSTSESIREIAHSYASSTLIKLGLVTALKEHFKDSNNPEVFIDTIDFDNRLSPNKELALYMIILEAFSNTVKHSNATEFLILFTEKNNTIRVIIENDGKGFAKIDNDGLGLKNMEIRVKNTLKGSIKIVSGHQTGTKIAIEFNREIS